MINKIKILKRKIKIWNFWRKMDKGNSLFHIRVFFGKEHSPYFEYLIKSDI